MPANYLPANLGLQKKKQHLKFLIGLYDDYSTVFLFLISNGNWTEWSTIQGVIGQVI